MGRRGRNDNPKFRIEQYDVYMKPSAIRYTQDSIKFEFYDGTAMTDTLWNLLHENVTPEDIEQIYVKWHDNNYYAVSGNRRLYLYKHLHKRSLVVEIPVSIVTCPDHVFNQYYTTNNQGRSIRLRGDRNGETEILNMIQAFITERRNNRQAEKQRAKKMTNNNSQPQQQNCYDDIQNVPLPCERSTGDYMTLWGNNNQGNNIDKGKNIHSWMPTAPGVFTNVTVSQPHGSRPNSPFVRSYSTTSTRNSTNNQSDIIGKDVDVHRTPASSQPHVSRSKSLIVRGNSATSKRNSTNIVPGGYTAPPLPLPARARSSVGSINSCHSTIPARGSHIRNSQHSVRNVRPASESVPAVPKRRQSAVGDEDEVQTGSCFLCCFSAIRSLFRTSRRAN